jgi:hypothetical protein
MENGKQNVYPITIEDNGNYSITHLGLTKREYFAGLAMQGLMTSQDQNGSWRHDIKTCAEISVQMADAILAELEKNNL